MSPPEDHIYNEMYWDDMPEIAHTAAKTLGYTKETWDDDEAVPYNDKAFSTCTNPEKQAAMFLNLNPIASKLNVWWEDLDETTKEHATAIGWTSDKWDEDYEIEHLDVEHLFWSELDSKQQAAASYFGYTKATWDETWNPSDFNVSSSSASNNKPSSASNDKPNKMFTPPPAGKVFGNGKKPEAKKEDKKEEDHDEKKEEHRLDFKPERLIKPFKKLFGKHDD
jgi:hypothetical protein